MGQVEDESKDDLLEVFSDSDWFYKSQLETICNPGCPVFQDVPWTWNTNTNIKKHAIC